MRKLKTVIEVGMAWMKISNVYSSLQQCYGVCACQIGIGSISGQRPQSIIRIYGGTDTELGLCNDFSTLSGTQIGYLRAKL